MVEQQQKYDNVFAFPPEDIEMYVRILARGFHTKKLTFSEFKEELKDVMLVDRDGTLWTVGAGSGAWYRREDDKWLRSIPPGELFSAHNVIKDMNKATRQCPSCHNRVPQGYRFCPHCGAPVAETAQQVAASPPPQRPASSAKPVFCRKCGKPIQPSAKFCTACGAPRRQ